MSGTSNRPIFNSKALSPKQRLPGLEKGWIERTKSNTNVGSMLGKNPSGRLGIEDAALKVFRTESSDFVSTGLTLPAFSTATIQAGGDAAKISALAEAKEMYSNFLDQEQKIFNDARSEAIPYLTLLQNDNKLSLESEARLVRDFREKHLASLTALEARETRLSRLFDNTTFTDNLKKIGLTDAQIDTLRTNMLDKTRAAIKKIKDDADKLYNDELPNLYRDKNALAFQFLLAKRLMRSQGLDESQALSLSVNSQTLEQELQKMKRKLNDLMVLKLRIPSSDKTHQITIIDTDGVKSLGSVDTKHLNEQSIADILDWLLLEKPDRKSVTFNVERRKDTKEYSQQTIKKLMMCMAQAHARGLTVDTNCNDPQITAYKAKLEGKSEKNRPKQLAVETTRQNHEIKQQEKYSLLEHNTESNIRQIESLVLQLKSLQVQFKAKWNAVPRDAAEVNRILQLINDTNVMILERSSLVNAALQQHLTDYPLKFEHEKAGVLDRLQNHSHNFNAALTEAQQVYTAIDATIPAGAGPHRATLDHLKAQNDLLKDRYQAQVQGNIMPRTGDLQNELQAARRVAPGR